MDTTVWIRIAAAEARIFSALTARDVDDAPFHLVTRALAKSKAGSGNSFSRLNDDIAQVQSGKIKDRANLTCKIDSETSAIVGADCGFAAACAASRQGLFLN